MKLDITFQLTPDERVSSGWLKVSKMLEHRLETLRRMNDKHRHHEDTIAIRSSIEEVKRILALGNPAPQVEPDVRD